MRFYSAILFALMAMVLPMAGVQQRFCTVNKTAACGPEQCLEEESHCCGEEGKHSSGEPVCMTSAKNLPNAQKSSPVEVPTLSANWEVLPAPPVRFFPPLAYRHISQGRDRGPPDRARLFLIQKRLLI